MVASMTTVSARTGNWFFTKHLLFGNVWVERLMV